MCRRARPLNRRRFHPRRPIEGDFQGMIEEVLGFIKDSLFFIGALISPTLRGISNLILYLDRRSICYFGASIFYYLIVLLFIIIG